MQTGKRVVIVGGVAGGASCAARVRRLDESAYVTVFDRGPFVSFANCGLPYFVRDVIQDEKKLLVASPELLGNRFNINVQTHGAHCFWMRSGICRSPPKQSSCVCSRIKKCSEWEP